MADAHTQARCVDPSCSVNSTQTARSLQATALPRTWIAASGNRTHASTGIGCSTAAGVLGVPISAAESEMGAGRITDRLTASSVRSDPYRLFVPTLRD